MAEAQQEPVGGMPIPPDDNEEPMDAPAISPLVMGTCFLMGIIIQTYSPLFNWISATILLAEIVLALALSSVCIALGVILTTQIPTIGLIANIVSYHFRLPHVISYQLTPQTVLNT